MDMETIDYYNRFLLMILGDKGTYLVGRDNNICEQWGWTKVDVNEVLLLQQSACTAYAFRSRPT